MTAYRVPPAIGLLVAIGILLAVNRLAPDLIQAVVALLILYLVATNVHRAAPFFEAAPRALEMLFNTPSRAPSPPGLGGR